MSAKRDEEFKSFVFRRRGALLRTSRALTAGDLHLAEDLVQQSLVKLYLAWPRIRSMDLDAYARRTLVNAAIDQRRRAFRRREQLWAELPEHTRLEIEGRIDDGDVLGALRRLPMGMRVAVVLRHIEGLSVEEVAAELHCSTGTVKSQTARGLDRLRALLDEPPNADQFASFDTNGGDPRHEHSD